MTIISGIVALMAVIGGTYIIVEGLLLPGLFMVGVALVIGRSMLHIIDTNTEIRELTERVKKLEEKLSEKEN